MSGTHEAPIEVDELLQLLPHRFPFLLVDRIVEMEAGVRISGLKNVTFSDFIPPTLKTAVFGWIVGVIACFQGMRTRGGTEGVGRAATSSVVLSSLFVVLADVVLVRLILTLWG